MEKVEVDLLTNECNYAILKLPSRSYPGIHYQGDSFYCLCNTIKSIKEKLNKNESRKVIDEHLDELLGELLGILQYYENTLTNTSGLVFDIKHYAVHDGPGVRVTIFFKGCPLHCQWCHSPESQLPEPELLLYGEKCIGCNNCVKACQKYAIKSPGVINRDACTMCGACVDSCYSGAIQQVGKQMSINEIMRVLNKDRDLLQNSGGGVTISGGEPMVQPEITIELLKRLKESGYHTALDTSGHAPWNIFERAIVYTDLLLYDLKHMDSGMHLKYTGVDNKLILNNLEKAKQLGKSIWIRVPLVPGLNDDYEHLNVLAKYVNGLDVERTYILPYHSLGAYKYESLGREYLLEVQPYTMNQLRKVKELVTKKLNDVVVMGIE